MGKISRTKFLQVSKRCQVFKYGREGHHKIHVFNFFLPEVTPNFPTFFSI